MATRTSDNRPIDSTLRHSRMLVTSGTSHPVESASVSVAEKVKEMISHCQQLLTKYHSRLTDSATRSELAIDMRATISLIDYYLSLKSGMTATDVTLLHECRDFLSRTLLS